MCRTMPVTMKHQCWWGIAFGKLQASTHMLGEKACREALMMLVEELTHIASAILTQFVWPLRQNCRGTNGRGSRGMERGVAAAEAHQIHDEDVFAGRQLRHQLQQVGEAGPLVGIEVADPRVLMECLAPVSDLHPRSRLDSCHH